MFTEKFPFPYYFYIVTNKNKTLLYCGMTNNLAARLVEHENSEVITKRLLADTIVIILFTMKVLILFRMLSEGKKR